MKKKGMWDTLPGDKVDTLAHMRADVLYLTDGTHEWWMDTSKRNHGHGWIIGVKRLPHNDH